MTTHTSNAQHTIPLSPSPLFTEYAAIKSTLPAGTILAIRLGDFLEIFGDEAKTAARVLNITLTNRRGIPMVGIPFWSVDSYTAKLVAAGYSVALANEEKKSLRVQSAP